MKHSTGLLIGLLAGVAGIVGCETSSSPNSTIRQVAANFTGVYENDGKPLASSQSGAEVKVLVLNQTGDRLEAFDERDSIWKGTIGEVFINDAGEAKAPFTLEGRTTAGQDVTISGQFTGQNTSGGGLGTMSGTWIEPTLFASFFAQGAISSINTNSNGGGGGTNNTSDVSISPSSATLNSDGDRQTFTASGGDGSYSWQISNVNGALTTTTGASVQYTRQAAGGNTITVTDNSSHSASASISQP